ncbi:hypothetical protein [Nocardia australiensis]|uniref:hypothetical protein n=1 Tax=Nocardia australiensis TaxID=2887191 RepID=UPI001D14583E|nr:hypothetical protein [Nocardia australiensis]
MPTRDLRATIAKGAAVTVEKCAALKQFAEAESGWRTQHANITGTPNDAVVTSGLRDAEAGVRAASTAVLDGAVYASAQQGQRAITVFLNNNDRNS